jgi:hypothetical protein
MMVAARHEELRRNANASTIERAKVSPRMEASDPYHAVEAPCPGEEFPSRMAAHDSQNPSPFKSISST